MNIKLNLYIRVGFYVEGDVVEATKSWTKKKLKRQEGAGERLKK